MSRAGKTGLASGLTRCTCAPELLLNPNPNPATIVISKIASLSAAITFITYYWQQSSISKTLIPPFSHLQQLYINRFQWWERGGDTSPANS